MARRGSIPACERCSVQLDVAGSRRAALDEVSKSTQAQHTSRPEKHVTAIAVHSNETCLMLHHAVGCARQRTQRKLAPLHTGLERQHRKERQGILYATPGLPSMPCAVSQASMLVAYVPQVCFSERRSGAVNCTGFRSTHFSLEDLTRSNKVVVDPTTGNAFQGVPGAEFERDNAGELVWQVTSFTPFPVASPAAGDLVSVKVGPVGERKRRTFLFEKVLPQPSELVVVTLPRPLGVVFEEDRTNQRAVVADVVEGSSAAQQLRLAAFDRSRSLSVARPGDVLRAVTATTLVYPARSLALGLKPPQRTVVLYGADRQSWLKVANALRQGLVADGPVTLVLERAQQMQ